MARAIAGAWLTATLATIAGVLLGIHPDAVRDGSALAAVGFVITYRN